MIESGLMSSRNNSMIESIVFDDFLQSGEDNFKHRKR